MRRAWRAVVGGLVSTLAMATIFLLIEVQTRARLRLFEALARFVGLPDRLVLGFLVFVFFGVVVWPLVFVVADQYLPPRDDSAVSGMVFATILWVGFLVIGTAEIAVVLLPFYAAVTLVAHLVYGFTLGLVYGWAPLATDGQTISRSVDGSKQ